MNTMLDCKKIQPTLSEFLDDAGDAVLAQIAQEHTDYAASPDDTLETETL